MIAITVAAIALAIVALTLVAYMVAAAARERDNHAKLLARMSLEWADERSELLERIVRPDKIPTRIRTSRRGTDRDKPKDLTGLAQVGRTVPGPTPEPGSEGA